MPPAIRGDRIERTRRRLLVGGAVGIAILAGCTDGDRPEDDGDDDIGGGGGGY